MILESIKIKQEGFSKSSNSNFSFSDGNSSLFIKTRVFNYALKSKLEFPSSREQSRVLSFWTKVYVKLKTRVSKPKLKFWTFNEKVLCKSKTSKLEF